MKRTNFKAQIALLIGGTYLIFLGYNQIYFKNTNSNSSLASLTQNPGITAPNSYGVYFGGILLGIILVVFAVTWFFKNLKSKK